MDNSVSKMQTLKSKIELFLTLLKRFWVVILIASIIGGVSGAIISRVIYTPEYTVTQAFSIKLDEHPELSKTNINDDQLSKTIPSLLSSDVFMEYMSPYIKQANAEGKFKVTSLESTNIFYLTATARSNEKCIKIIEEIKLHYNDLAKSIIGESEMVFYTDASKNILPSNSPHFTLGTIIGALTVFIVLIALLIVKTVISNTITTSLQAEKITKSKCLATIKSVSIKHSSNNNTKEKYKMPLVTDDNCELDILQDFSAIANNVISKCADKDINSILMTSTISGEGKSSISLNLALELTLKGYKVAIVDADLRTPSIANYLGINEINGTLSDVINGKTKLSQAITTHNGLDILSNLESIENAFEQETSSNFSTIINELEKSYDYVIVDAPPVGILGDAISIAEATKGYIYVISHNFITENQLLQSISSLDNSSSQMLGFVINHKK